MSRSSAQRIFITGGASGLGQALAKRYAREGWRVCIGDLDVERCAATLAAISQAGGTGHALKCDVTQEADLVAAAEWLKSEWGGVDVVVNNAGVAQAGRIESVDLEDWKWIVDINLLGVVRGCKVFVPVMRQQGGGQIINVASMAGLIHMPNMSAYNATKAAVVALSETLLAELASDGIKVSVVCPAFFKTNLTATMRVTAPGLLKATRKLVDDSKHSADWVADLVYKGTRAGKFHILTHLDAKAAWQLKKMLPYKGYYAVLEREFRKFAKSDR